jgi:hypothetical protein
MLRIQKMGIYLVPEMELKKVFKWSFSDALEVDT